MQMIDMKMATCNQCNTQMHHDDKFTYCINAPCPNFALVQISQEEILNLVKDILVNIEE